jgi:hypothetical protein
MVFLFTRKAATQQGGEETARRRGARGIKKRREGAEKCKKLLVEVKYGKQ